MSTVLDALVKLESSIISLEESVSKVETSLAGQQRDMFVNSSSGAANTNGETSSSLDIGAVADKLDNIIDHAETVLKESHG